MPWAAFITRLVPSKPMKIFHLLLHLAASTCLLVSDLPAQGPAAAPTTQPPELAELAARFDALKKQRVSLPFDAAVAELTDSYLKRIDELVFKKKQSKRLEALVALEEEKARFLQTPVVPEKDPEGLHDLIQELYIHYRVKHAMIASRMGDSLKGLLSPLHKRLLQMEGEWKAAGRAADGEQARAYRASLVGEGLGLKPALTSQLFFMDPPEEAPEASSEPVTTNTLGMKFRPVPGTTVLFCLHETRRQDYAAYASDVKGVRDGWKKRKYVNVPAGHEDNHPVIFVHWNEAQAFCEWLSSKEGKKYRLPTDREWSIAVGIGDREAWTETSTPESLHWKLQGVYPWGRDPLPKSEDRVGNLADLSFHAKFPSDLYMENYEDGYVTTAPVMSYKPNKFGLYDLAGNVSEWIADWYNAEQKDRVVRGSPYSMSAGQYHFSSFRSHTPPDRYSDARGFRVVIEQSAAAQ